MSFFSSAYIIFLVIRLTINKDRWVTNLQGSLLSRSGLLKNTNNYRQSSHYI